MLEGVGTVAFWGGRRGALTHHSADRLDGARSSLQGHKGSESEKEG